MQNRKKVFDDTGKEGEKACMSWVDSFLEELYKWKRKRYKYLIRNHLGIYMSKVYTISFPSCPVVVFIITIQNFYSKISTPSYPLLPKHRISQSELIHCAPQAVFLFLNLIY